LPWAIALPQHFEPNYAYPLVVWLHPSGFDEHHSQWVLPRISTRNYMAVGVRGLNCGDARWYGWPQTPRGIVRATGRIEQAIAAVEAEYRIHPRRIFIGGQRAGGTMAFRAALWRPDLFAGAISLGGPFPRQHTPLANLQRVRGTSVFWTHSRHDRSFPEGELCSQLRLLHAAGINVALRQYPASRQLPKHVWHDLNVWMMDEIRAADPSSSVIR
jgi:phospholipase/carboxylesterase